MRKCTLLLCAALLVTVGCSTLPTPETTPPAVDTAAARGAQAPAGSGSDDKGGDARLEWAQTLRYDAEGPFPVDLRSIPAGVYDPFNKMDTGRGSDRPGSPISRAEADRLRAEALRMPADEGIAARAQGPLTRAATAGVSFDSLDFNDCCGGGGNVPPDTEIAVGPNHVIVVVNVAFEIYDKSGNVLSGPTTFSSFFAGTPGCSNTGVFDPNVLYDESADRFILGIDGDGTDYCVAATTGSNPLGTWNRYGFPTDFSGAFFDFPHIGVGLDAIYMGSNQFSGGGFLEARVFAMDKAAMYAGTAMNVVSHSTGNDGTPQPAQLSGFNQGTWPSSGPHYIMTEVFDGALHTVWSWSDPFGADVLTRLGNVNLNTATGITAGFPVDWPQPGSSRNIQGNDWRGQHTFYRNGNLWMSNNMACNPGGGTVNCVRWAQIDPVSLTVLDAGVLGSNGEYRTFPSVAVNHCDDMMIGYTKGSATSFPAVFIAGRESGDAPGTLQPEAQIKAGEVTYSSFEASGAYRWGDYTKMAIDPDGVTFWYAGEYSKETGSGTKWGNFVGSFSFPGCSVVPQECGNGVIEGNEVCDGGDLGGATCGDQGCTGGGSLACNATCDGFDTSGCLDCPVCDNDFVCDAGEDCFSCPTDCASGTTTGAVCGNGVCEAGNGENCVTCAADCNGRQSGNPSRRFCCGDGGGQNPVACSDSRCSADGNSCTDIPVSPGSFCCGDLTCDVGESCANCALDCAGAVELCDNGIDDDCNGLVDCADLACTGDPVCDGGSCGGSGDSCSTDADCCSNRCKGNGTCR